MDFLPKGLKGFAAEAATALNRAVQFTEERLGHSERTELDGYFENLLSRAEQIKSWTEKIVTSAESVLQPNPGTRVEDYLIEKLAVSDMKRKERLRNLEWLGSNMVAAGQELTPGDTYGSALIKCGQTQLKIGQTEREFAANVERDFIKPLKKFLDEDAKALTREKRVLEVKRLDLDATKSKYKKVRSTDQPHQSSNQPYDQVVKELEEAEGDLRRAQEEFDRQVELVTEICNKIIKSNEQHVKHLSKFVEAQAEYYQQSDKHLNDLLNNRTITSQDSQRNDSTGFATFAALSDAGGPSSAAAE